MSQGNIVVQYQSVGRCIEVVIQESDVRRDVWRFSQWVQFNAKREDVLVLSLLYFAHQTRQTSRHKWRQDHRPRFDANDNRAYPHGDGIAGLEAQNVLIPQAVADAAKAFVASRIEIKIPTRRNN